MAPFSSRWRVLGGSRVIVKLDAVRPIVVRVRFNRTEDSEQPGQFCKVHSSAQIPVESRCRHIRQTAEAAEIEALNVSWSGDSYPEEEGWTRTIRDANGVPGQGGANRTIEDGVMTLDSLRSVQIVDFYRYTRPLDPGPNETFVATWRLAVGETIPPQRLDAGVSFASDTSGFVALRFGAFGFESVLDESGVIPLTPGIPHDYRFISSDMRTFSLFVDGTLSLSGSFRAGAAQSRVGWGDVIQGVASRSQWDDIEFGVVPEPSSFIGITTAFGFFLRRRK